MQSQQTESLKETTTEDWDLVITPHKKWYDLQLHDVWNYRDLIGLFVRRDFVSRYKQTILGPLWFIIRQYINSKFIVIPRIRETRSGSLNKLPKGRSRFPCFPR